MAYEPTQWRSGDTITSERLNKMEQGIAGSGGGIFMITADMESGTFLFSNVSATFEEATEAYINGMLLTLRVRSAVGDGQYLIFDVVQYATAIVSGEILRFVFTITVEGITKNIIFDSNGLAIQSGGDA